MFSDFFFLVFLISVIVILKLKLDLVRDHMMQQDDI